MRTSEFTPLMIRILWGYQRSPWSKFDTLGCGNHMRVANFNSRVWWLVIEFYKCLENPSPFPCKYRCDLVLLACTRPTLPTPPPLLGCSCQHHHRHHFYFANTVTISVTTCTLPTPPPLLRCNHMSPTSCGCIRACRIDSLAVGNSAIQIIPAPNKRNDRCLRNKNFDFTAWGIHF